MQCDEDVFSKYNVYGVMRNISFDEKFQFTFNSSRVQYFVLQKNSVS